LKKILLFLALVTLWGAKAQAQVTEAYYTDQNGTESIANIPWSDYTQVVLFQAQAGVNGGGTGDGSVDSTTYLTTGDITAFVAAAHAAGKLAFVCVKDNNAHSSAFPQDTAGGLVSTFATNIASFITTNGFDGVELDWEQGVVASQYQALIAALHTDMPSKKINMAGYNDSSSGSNIINTAVAESSVLNQVAVECYDLDLGEGRTLYNDPLFQAGNSGMRACDWAVKAYTTAGVPKPKILVGMPFYGRRWAGSTLVLQTTGVTPSKFLYRDLVTDATRWQPQFRFYDSTYGSDYLSIPSPAEFDSFTGPTTIAAIVAWGKAQGYGGFMAFTLDNEYLASAVGVAKYPLSTALATRVNGTDVYITQSGSGAQDGLTCATAKPVSYFNTAGNWTLTPTGIQIGPDTTVHLCGAFTDTTANDVLLTFQAGGTSGHPITLFFETGATLTNTNYWSTNGAIFSNGNSNIVVDGGTNGLIQNTGNGSGLANQKDSRGMLFIGCQNCQFKNLAVNNIYVHLAGTSAGSPGEDGPPIGPTAAGIACNGACNNTRIGPNNTLREDEQGIEMNWLSNGVTNGEIDHNTTFHTNWGIMVAGVSVGLNGFKIHDNNIGDENNWDDWNDGNHHNGIIVFETGPASTLTGLQVYNNTIAGDFSDLCSGIAGHTTAWIFYDVNGGTWVSPQTFNNVLVNTNANCGPANGFITAISNSGPGAGVYNNTFKGRGSAVGVTGTIIIKNNLVSQTDLGISNLNGTIAAGTDYNLYFGLTGANQPPSAVMVDHNGLGFVSLISTWIASSGFDTHGQQGNPNLTGTFGPGTGSAAINTGINLTSLGIAALNVDKNGVARPSTGPWTMGAINPSGTPPAPGLAITPNPASFGSVNVGSASSPVLLTVTSNGTATATLAASIATFSDQQFAITSGGTSPCTPNQSLPVSSTCTLNMAFSPTSAGVKNATITVGANATASAGLSGTGTAGTASMSVTPSSWNFGSVTKGTASASETFLITNTGTTSITMATPVSTFSGSSDFSLFGTSTCTSGQILAPGGTCQKSVIVTPSIVGAESGTVTFSSTTASASATLTATGTAPPVPSILITPRPVTFASSFIGTPSPAVTATITNNGNVALTLTATPLSISGDFQQTGTTCTANLPLAVNATCTATLTFTPTTATAETGSLTVSSTVTTNTDTLSGTGLNPLPPPVPPAPSPAFIISMLMAR
jgi:hypothetical protein